jgi:hypothetical protein
MVGSAQGPKKPESRDGCVSKVLSLQLHTLNSVAPPAPVLNDVHTVIVGRAFFRSSLAVYIRCSSADR